MKKIIFTLFALIAIVSFSNKTYAQSTYNNAYVGATHDYTLSSLATGDTWAFYIYQGDDGVNTPVTDYNALPGSELSVATFNNGKTGTVSNSDQTTGDYTIAANTATANITWSSAGTYNLWFVITDNATSGCSNYRYVEVTVTAYDLAFRVLALQTGRDAAEDLLTLPGNNGGASITDCPEFIAPDFEVINGEDGDEDDVYVYFKVERYNTSGGSISDSDWKFTPSISVGSATVSNWVYAYDADFSGTPSSINMNGTTEFLADGAYDEVYIRATVVNLDNNAIQAIDLNIGDDTVGSESSTAYEVTGDILDTTVGTDDVSTLTISALPEIGIFSGN